MSGVEIRVRSNSTQARQDLGKLQKSVGNIEQSTKRLQSAFNKIAIGGAAFLSLASFTKGITRASDSITNMENKIALVTGRGRELNSTMQSLARVSSQTRVSFSTTAETFNRFGLALREAAPVQENFWMLQEQLTKLLLFLVLLLNLLEQLLFNSVKV